MSEVQYTEEDFKKLDLKLQHYKQSLVELNLESQEKIAELRIELTLVTENLNTANAKIEELENEASQKKK